MTFDLHLGDCIDVMASLPAESVDAVITSPPYAEQRKTTYGGIPEAEYPEWSVAWMREAKRLLKPDGSAIINISPHVRNGELSDYVLWTRISLRRDGWKECEELIWHKPDAMPTAPPNKPRRSWESLLWYAKHGKPYADPRGAGTPQVRTDQRMSNRATRNGWSHGDGGNKHGLMNTTPPIARVPNVVTLAKAKASDIDHPAIFPWQLAAWCGKLICPPGGTILDPFSGSASTGVAAIANGWHYIGIDAVPEYIDMSQKRLERAAANALKN